MPDDPRPPESASPFLTSKVFIGAVVAAILALSAAFPGLEKIVGHDPVALETKITTGLALFAGLSALWTAIKRWIAPMNPLTVTQAAADIHPATIAAIAKTETANGLVPGSQPMSSRSINRQ